MHSAASISNINDYSTREASMSDCRPIKNSLHSTLDLHRCCCDTTRDNCASLAALSI